MNRKRDRGVNATSKRRLGPRGLEATRVRPPLGVPVAQPCCFSPHWGASSGPGPGQLHTQKKQKYNFFFSLPPLEQFISTSGHTENSHLPKAAPRTSCHPKQFHGPQSIYGTATSADYNLTLRISPLFPCVTIPPICKVPAAVAVDPCRFSARQGQGKEAGCDGCPQVPVSRGYRAPC